jgi:hypothetical protein
MMVVVGVMMVVAVVAVILSQVAWSVSQHSRTRDDRIIGLAPADSGANEFLTALRQDIVDETHGYLLDPTTMAKLADGGQTALLNTDPLVAPEMKQVQGAYMNGLPDVAADASVTSYAVTMREPLSNGDFGYWQIYRIDEPSTASGGNLAVYIRAWVADAQGSASAARTVRVEYRPGYFSGYLLLTDGYISFEGNATINGNVHSNGFSGDPFTPAGPGGEAVYFDNSNGGAAPRCVKPANGDMQVETSQGRVNLSSGSCVPFQSNGADFVNLLNAETTFTKMQQSCAAYPSGPVTCASDANVTEWRAILNGTSVTYFGFDVAGNEVAGPTTVATGGQHTILFDNDVWVTGRSTGLLTIATHSPPNQQGEEAAPNIVVDGSAGSTVGATASTDVLGLVSQGDIIVNIDNSRVTRAGSTCEVARINAAMVAESGRLTIPTSYTGAVQQGGPACRNLTVFGSISAHFAPVVYWSPDKSAGYIGYATRSYSYNQFLTANPPPYFPMTGAWDQGRWSDANDDCLASGGGTSCE